MSVILDSQFATAEDTAAALGVSDARLKRLMRLAGPKASARRALAAAGYKTGTNGKFKLKSAGRKKQPRGKTKKAAH
ncbi:MAG TPA: hypothetical protein VN830_00205 [Verrucomicrobiae bacterium]|nr:hypothetical protein [Verrucomicrobiae bacterium]